MLNKNFLNMSTSKDVTDEKNDTRRNLIIGLSVGGGVLLLIVLFFIGWRVWRQRTQPSSGAGEKRSSTTRKTNPTLQSIQRQNFQQIKNQANISRLLSRS